MRELIFAEAEPNLSFAERGEETLVMTPGGSVYKFNTLQAEILKSLDGKSELREVARRCATQLGQEIELDELREFVSDAQSIGLLSLRSAEPGADAAPFLAESARKLGKKLRASGLPPPKLPTDAALFAEQVVERLEAGDARGAAAAAAALQEVLPPQEWLRYVDSEVQRLLRPRSAVSVSLGRVTVPLFNPAGVLVPLDRWLGWLFSAKGLMIWAGIVLLGMRLSPPVALLQLHDYFNGYVILVMYAFLALSIVIHEFGHALACHHYGGRVSEMGVGWLFVSPIAFADVTSSYLFPKKRHRLIVMLAGTLGSLLSIALATFTWYLVPKGGVVDLGLRAFLLSGWFSIFFNLVPFQKTDGYFLLADLFGVDDLTARAAACRKAFARAWVTGEPIQDPEESTRTTAILLIYSALDVAYIAFMYLVLMPYVYAGSPPDSRRLVVLFGTLGAVSTVVIPALRAIYRVLVYAVKHPREVLTPPRVWRWAIPLGGLVAVTTLLSFRETSEARFTLRPIERIEVRTEVGGQVTAIPVHGGEAIQVGQLLAVLSNPDLELQRQLAVADLELAEIELARFERGARAEDRQVARSEVALSAAELHKATDLARRISAERAQGLLTADGLASTQEEVAQSAEQRRFAARSFDLVNSPSRSEDLAQAEAKVKGARTALADLDVQRARLELRSPIEGEIDDLDLNASLGRWLSPGEAFATVVDGSRFVGQLVPNWLLHPERVIGGAVQITLPDGRKLKTTVAKTLFQTADPRRGVTLETAPIEASGLAAGIMGRSVIFGPAEPLGVQYLVHPLQRFFGTVLWTVL